MKRLLITAATFAALLAGAAEARPYSDAVRPAEQMAQKGDYDGAAALMEQVAAEAVRRGDRLLYAEASGTLGGAMVGIGQIEAAGPVLKRAWDIREEILGPDHPMTLYSINDYGVWLFIQGRDHEAEPLLARAAEGLTARARTEEDLADAAEARSSHAMTLFRVGSWEQAESQMLSAIEVLATRPDKGVQLLSAYTILADGYITWGRHADARPVAEKTLALYETLMGPDSPHSVGPLILLGQTNLNLGDHGAAEAYYQRAIEVAHKLSAGVNPYATHALVSLANFYSATGRPEEALPIYRRAFEAYAGAGDDSWRAAEAYRMYAVTLAQLGRPDEAVEPARRALELLERGRGPESEQAASARLVLARIALDRGEAAEADRWAREALALFEKALSTTNPRLDGPLILAAEVAEQRGDWTEAASLYRRAIEVARTERPAYHPSLTGARAWLAQALIRSGGDTAEAYALAREGASALQQLALANARVIGRGGAPNLSAQDREVFEIAVSAAWAHRQRLEAEN